MSIGVMGIGGWFRRRHDAVERFWYIGICIGIHIFMLTIGIKSAIQMTLAIGVGSDASVEIGIGGRFIGTQGCQDGVMCLV